MKLNDIDSKVLLPSWSRSELLSRAVCTVFDKYIKTMSGRIDSLPANASANSISCMTDDELNRLGEDLCLIAYNKKFDRTWRESVIMNTSSIFMGYGTENAIEQIIMNSTPTGVDGVLVGENTGLKEWTLLISSRDPIPVVSANIYNTNAIDSSRVSQMLSEFTYEDHESFNLSLNCGGSAGCEITARIEADF